MSALATHGYRMSRTYAGKLKAAVLDWSGTTVDRYVIAPAKVFCDVFEKHGVPISMVEAREPMGLRKDVHIASILRTPQVSQRWFDAHGKFPTDADVDALFEDFAPMQLAVLEEHAWLLPGVVETTDALRDELGLQIGMTTGFTREMVDVLLEQAALQGFHPDAAVAGDDVANGVRPKPFMVYENMAQLDIHPIQSVLKVDDTVGGVGEGLEAGCWTAGVARFSNYMDVDSLDHECTLSEDDIAQRLERSRTILRGSGAHYVVDDLRDLPEVVRDINARLARGEQP